MEQLGPLPGVEAVLNKLKSDGTFDHFRKTCLSSIEGEPSFRAYSEHIEVVSRRYLQNYKWRESTTKNQVRGKLKDHALGVIAGPDIQVGVPLPSVVEKVLESKSKELLPKIVEIVDRLRQTQTKPPDSASKTSTTTITQPSDAQTATKTSSTSEPELTKPKLSEFGGLSLPIVIPGLNFSSGSTKKEPTASGVSNGKAVKAKSKTIDGGTPSNKETTKGGGGSLKNKPVQGTSSGGPKPAVPKEKQKEKEREKDDKSKGSDDGVIRGKGLSKPKKVKDEPKQEAVSGQQEESQENRETCVTDNTNDSKDTEPESKDQKVSNNKTESKSSKQGQTRGKEKEASKDKETETKEKPVTTRRSARLASLTENKDDSKMDEVEEQENMSEAMVPNEETAERKSHKGKKRPRVTKGTKLVGRKKARVISSSSEEGEQAREEEASCSDDDSHKQSRDERSPACKEKGKTKDGSGSKAGRVSRKRPRQHNDDEEVTQLQHKKPRSKSNNGNGSKSAATTHESGASVETQPSEQQADSKPNKRKSKKPQRLPQRASKSPPVVITRYNRHVKPNRRYLDNTSGDEGEHKSDREDTEEATAAAVSAEEASVSGGSEIEEKLEGGSHVSSSEDEEAKSPLQTSEKTGKTKNGRTRTK